MNPRRPSRTQACSEIDAAARLRHARKFIEVAELVADEGEDVDYSSQAGALAVLAGIAASDAVCCKNLGIRSRGPNHRDATMLLKRVTPDGAQAAATLDRLLSLKDEAHYGLLVLGRADLRSALRQANWLLDFARAALEA